MHILLPSSVPHLNASPLCNSAASVHFSGAVLAGAALPRFSCYSSVRAPPLYPARTTSVLRPPQRWGYSAPDLFMAIGGAYGGLPEGSASSGRKEQLPPPTNCCEDVPNSVDYDGKTVTFGDYRRSSFFGKLFVSLVAGGVAGTKALPIIGRMKRTPVKVLAAVAAFYLAWRGRPVISYFYSEIILQPKLHSPGSVAYSNSCFRKIRGLKVHYLREDPKVDGTDVAPRTVLHMTHGFGASSSSWMPVIDQLSRGLGALAVAHDTPGFGLTDRPSWWMAPKYSLQFNAEITKELLQYPQEQGGAAEKESSSSQYIVMGHSVGCITAATASLDDSFPPKNTTLVLVAPVITAPSEPARSMVTANDGTGRSGKVADGGSSDAVGMPPFGGVSHDGRNTGRNVVRTVGDRICAALRFLVNFPRMVAKAMEFTVLAFFVQFVFPLFYPLDILGIRAFAYRGNLWRAVLRWIWFDKSGVDLDVVNRYRWPTLVRFWDRGMSLFLIHRLRSGLEGMTGPAWLVKAVADKAAKGMKVVIVQGENDTVACLAKGFIANATAIAHAVPESTLVSFAECGHIPHEECPEKFVKVVLEQIGQ